MDQNPEKKPSMAYGTLPDNSMIREEGRDFSYVDTCTVLINRQDIANWELLAGFFHSTPKWFDFLAKLRDRVVWFFRLKTASGDPKRILPPYLPGQQIGFFQVIKLSDRGVLLGQDDKHLDFRTSLMMMPHPTGTVLAVSTAVETKNLLGRVYFAIVGPIHRWMVPVLLKGMVRVIEERALPPDFYANTK
ncbi:DUF2867 domain-containing protein [Verminephrobacter aporrectodeae subsp. tuberculatae]|uniref:DUF2867 domain-containing protein n=1 Tax=Verminephrobacter aporrectodeae TaxID=1110389 RepID=UPI0022373A23|nr:DUF2867 domain-containing protein [Verminephrobacter aporrectodeae]MCW5256134.1 DUF2867 domain-containing protein [Verminephrobacter aporrectodeae subsp. tuberculatae]MCW8206536.1 DUF2867 domain-containing protein [Verminephrobacter aporrectodeae subsp. tuberculatae]